MDFGLVVLCLAGTYILNNRDRGSPTRPVNCIPQSSPFAYLVSCSIKKKENYGEKKKKRKEKKIDDDFGVRTRALLSLHRLSQASCPTTEPRRHRC